MDFLEAMQHRFACKLYDRKRMLDDSQITNILEYGRLTPTSFGLELWSFHVVKSLEKKEALFHACFDQESVRTSAMTVAVLVRTSAFANPDGDLVHTRGKRFGIPFLYSSIDYRPITTFSGRSTVAAEEQIICRCKYDDGPPPW